MNKQIPETSFVSTVAANVDNEKLSDAEFRQFIRNTLPIVADMTLQEVKEPVITEDYIALHNLNSPGECTYTIIQKGDVSSYLRDGSLEPGNLVVVPQYIYQVQQRLMLKTVNNLT